MILQKEHQRFIPVYTGNIRKSKTNFGSSSVYPCVYREHYFSASNQPIASRFIPVYTGNITYLNLGKLNRSVYPCVYREHQLFVGFLINTARFIPVYTGNISSLSSKHLPISVYPCVYREHISVVIIMNIMDGLSLCIQGTCRRGLQTVTGRRFIPVYTGNISFNVSDLSHRSVYPCVYREHTNYNILFYN